MIGRVRHQRRGASSRGQAKREGKLNGDRKEDFLAWGLFR